ncbi:MAG: hypothetical protein OXG35_04400 [Acidobacteria bacterium]|nr:hypothetical protein [Acidobacteriota bacterium]
MNRRKPATGGPLAEACARLATDRLRLTWPGWLGPRDVDALDIEDASETPAEAPPPP